MKRGFRLVVLSFLFIAGCSGVIRADEPPDHVLFIAIDDMNDWIEPLEGYPGTVHTPNLDQFASKGMTFTNAHTAASACHPSRVAVMTGVRPTTSNITTNTFPNDPGPKWRNRKPLEDAVTLSQHFRNNGFRAIGGGKIYHALQWDDNLSLNDPDTWDSYYPSWKRPIPHQIRAPEKVRNQAGWIGNRPHSHFTWGPIPAPDRKMSDFNVVNWAIDQLEKTHEKPLFLATGLFRPHMPWEVPETYFDMYPIDEIRIPPHRPDDLADAWIHDRRHWHQYVRQNNRWKSMIQAYLASISFVDAQVGRLLNALERTGRADDTMVVLWSDHGMHIGLKEKPEKFTVWEESTRVPLMIRAPGVTEPGSRSAEPVSLLDVYPTLADLAGTDPPSHQLDGESLVPLLNDADTRTDQPAITSHGRQHSVRTRRWRYILNPNGLEELYDHREDPNEFINIAYKPSVRDQLNRHRTLLKKFTDLSVPSGRPTLPDTYRLTGANRPRRKNFVRLQDVVKAAKRAHDLNFPIPKINRNAVPGLIWGPADIPLQAGRTLDRKPYLPDRPIRIEATITPGNHAGVVLAQGGNLLGIALFIDPGGHVVFAIRKNDRVHRVRSNHPIDGRTEITARLTQNGKMKLTVDQQKNTVEVDAGLIRSLPYETLSAGKDVKTHVVDYGDTDVFDGTIHSLKLHLGKMVR